MQKHTFTRRVLTATVLFLAPFAVSAQEIQKEVHIKIVENGVVTKDTVYNYTGTSDETELLEAHLPKRENADRKYIIEENREYVVKGNAEKDFEWVEKRDRQKELKVIVHKDGGEHGNQEVEEIWMGKSAEDGPCRTIIIHEGDCPGKEVEIIREGPGPIPPVPPRVGENPVKIEKKIIKTENGEKVIITETIVNDKSARSKKGKKKE